ncbi:MAG TPA: rRNA maturation RNase YbeY [Steroidobacteraceae bacterium]|nr:rRNA maturation RNase YbeY [Steroidobacteraceae bacterium]
MSGRPGLTVEAQYAARRPWVPARAALERWAGAARRAVLRGRRRKREDAVVHLCVRVVGHAASRRLNRTYRGKDKATNVLSFPASRDERRFGGSLGDLVICAPVVAAEARGQGKALPAHWAHMVVHGVLHLHGYDHEHPRAGRAMERLEVEILRGFGYQNPYLPVTDPGP